MSALAAISMLVWLAVIIGALVVAGLAVQLAREKNKPPADDAWLNDPDWWKKG